MARLTAFVTWLALASGAAVLAARQPPMGRAAVAELEKAVVDTVAKAEASVVAIARVRKDVRDRSGEWFDVAPGRFGFPGAPSTTDPDSPDFAPQEYATGVVIDRNGLIVTTHSVLGDIAKNDYHVWSQRRRWQAQVLAADPWLDLAVLKVEATDLQPIKFGDAKTLQKGQFVVALGNPYGIAKDGDVSARWGIVANLNRTAALPRPRGIQAETVYQLGSLIETDALLERGTAGGPLLNLDGEMIGLTTSYLAEPYAERGGNLAIPVDQAFTGALEKLKSGRKAEYGFLGISTQNVPGQNAPGAVVQEIVPGTPAETARFEVSGEGSASDRITHVDDIEVADSNHLIVLLSRLPAQSVVQLTLLRYDRGPLQPPRQLQKEVTLAKKHIDTLRPAYATVVDPPWRGATVDFATAMPGVNLRRSGAERDCVGVLEIERDSPIWKAGLRPGSYISHVDDQPVRTPTEFREAVEGKMGTVTLRVREDFTGDREIQVLAP